MALGSPFFDVPRLLRLRASLREVDSSRAPSARLVVDFAERQPRRLALLPGSFNPLTNAHVALADLALGSGRVDGLAYLLASRTINKERVEGASLVDRLVCLEEWLKQQPGAGVVVVNRGLYVDQAELIRRAMPALDELWFVVGFDKIVQIFDPRYYDDRDAALGRLFSLASFLVSPREPARPEDLDEFLARSENRGYADLVVKLDLPARFQRLSSTRVRDASRRGEASADVPSIVKRFIRETGAYEAPSREPDGEEVDRYALREQLVDLVDRGKLPPLPAASFRELVGRLSARGAAARRRRAALRIEDVSVALGEELEQMR